MGGCGGSRCPLHLSYASKSTASLWLRRDRARSAGTGVGATSQALAAVGPRAPRDPRSGRSPQSPDVEVGLTGQRPRPPDWATWGRRPQCHSAGQAGVSWAGPLAHQVALSCRAPASPRAALQLRGAQDTSGDSGGRHPGEHRGGGRGGSWGQQPQPSAACPSPEGRTDLPVLGEPTLQQQILTGSQSKATHAKAEGPVQPRLSSGATRNKAPALWAGWSRPCTRESGEGHEACGS